MSLLNLLHPLDKVVPCDWDWKKADPEMFRFRFGSLDDSHRTDPGTITRDVRDRFVGQIPTMTAMSERELEMHFRGLFMYAGRIRWESRRYNAEGCQRSITRTDSA